MTATPELTDPMEARILAGEFEPPLAVSGRPMPKGSGTRSSSGFAPIMVGSLWDMELEDDVPTLGAVAGGSALLYQGTDHYLAGPAGSGKTYVAMHLGHECVAQNSAAVVLFIDYESSFSRFLRRLRQLGVTREQADRIGYVRPTGSLLPHSPYGRAFHAWLEEHRPDLVVIDSVMVSLNAAGLSENDSADVTTWWYSVISPMNDLGITSLRIDHTGREQPGKDNRDARGSSAKLQRVDGAAYSMRAVNGGWSKHASGYAELVALKDRGGEYVAGQKVARVIVTVHDHTVDVRLEATTSAPRNEDGTVRLTGLMEKISRTAENAPAALSLRQLRELVGGNARTVGETVTLLTREGYLTTTDGPRGAKLVTSARAYRQQDDPLSDKYAGDTPF